MIIIALCGKAQVGKDTTADYLVENYGFKKFAYANYVKNVAELGGWDGLKDERGRRYLQHLGDIMREYDKDIIVNELIAKISYYKSFCEDNLKECRVVISDVRLLSEIEALKKLDSSIWLIKRDLQSIGACSTHVTEQMNETVYPFDVILENNGTFNKLYGNIQQSLTQLSDKI